MILKKYKNFNENLIFALYSSSTHQIFFSKKTHQHIHNTINKKIIRIQSIRIYVCEREQLSY